MMPSSSTLTLGCRGLRGLVAAAVSLLALPAALALGVAGTGCNLLEPSDSGLSAQMRVSGARHYTEDLDAPDGGPEVIALTASNTRVRAGATSRSINGVAPKGTEALALSFSGEHGHWRIPSGSIDPNNLAQVLFDAQLSFSQAVKPGPYEVIARGLDDQGRAGPPKSMSIEIVGSTVPDGTLAITLTWDLNADLDLHVVTPANVEIWSGKINSYTPPPVGVIDPDQVAAGGVLLYDSNSQCVLDGLREESVVWTLPPPAGHYLVRVDTFSLCGQPGATWRAEARLNGQRLGSATGNSVDADTRQPHEKGAGLLALEFDVP